MNVRRCDVTQNKDGIFKFWKKKQAWKYSSWKTNSIDFIARFETIWLELIQVRFGYSIFRVFKLDMFD